MSTAPVVIEVVPRRVLGSFVCVDAVTGTSIQRPMQVSAAGWTIKPNRSGIYVVWAGPNLQEATTQFVPAGTWPAASLLAVTLQDGQREYLPRLANVNAPQKVPVIPPAPAGSATNPATLASMQDPTTIFCPQKVMLYPTPAANTEPNWAVIRASATNSNADGAGVAGSVLQVVRTSDGTVLGTGVTDANGEALISVAGIATTMTNTTGAPGVTVSTVAVTVNAYVNPANVNKVAGTIFNPDSVLSNVTNPALKVLSQSMQIASGQQQFLSFVFAL